MPMNCQAQFWELVIEKTQSLGGGCSGTLSTTQVLLLFRPILSLTAESPDRGAYP